MRHRKPCPGCKAVDQYRIGDDVCEECKRLIKIGREEKDRSEALGKKKRKLFRLPGACYHLPYIPAGKDDRDHRNRAPDVFQGAFWKLAQLVGKGSPVYPGSQGYKIDPIVVPDGSERSGFSDVVLEIDPEIVDQLTLLYNMTSEIADNRFKEGFESGRNVLTGLQDGSLSMDEAIKREASAAAVGSERKKRRKSR